MDTLGSIKVALSMLLPVMGIMLAIAISNLILLQIPFGIKLNSLKRKCESKITPVYELHYSNVLNTYTVKKHNLGWHKTDFDKIEYLFIPFLMLFFHYGYVVENEGYKYTGKSFNEKDLEIFYEYKKLEAKQIFEKRAKKRKLNK